MIRQYKFFLKQSYQLAASLMLAISIVMMTAQESLAIPLEPIINQQAIRLLEEWLGIDSNNQAAPYTNQSWINTQQKPNFATYSPCPTSTYSQVYTGCPSNFPQTSPNIPVPTYIPMYPQGYPGYLPGSSAPTYILIYPQVSPSFSTPTYIPIYPQISPGFSAPTYIPMYPQGYP
ncbi:hypothetical protein [Halotia branconii]|uniref:Uncharacterized protein n=1 Tax=Halotia branconii CENA392 TaxID=1539056 RepID=A0AAJ6P7V7_9CYAN|nr:hypothetical protein [Halotia branconii]WGV23971.1 hypothetical protein QI031_19450 [Halotia branconii CENA392]